MQIRIFNIPLTDTGELHAELNRFLAGHKVLEVEQRFFQNEKGGCWSFCVRYLSGIFNPSGGNGFGTTKAKVDYKEVLSETAFAVFSRLREIRKALAAEDGVPAYAVFTDEELAGVARLPEVTEKGMLAVPGIGEKKGYFTIHDPKERLICAASFHERVLHHALMNVCHPFFERFQTEDSYATRLGKGQYAALDRARDHTRRYRWFCKLDVRKFFDSISHEVLYAKLCRIFKDPLLLRIFRQIIDSYAVSPGKGLPIGNLTSQYFANFYMGYADHYAREVLHSTAYVRYMDDMVLWSNDKGELLRQKQQLEQQRPELPLCLPEQQQSRQCEQQYRVPGGFPPLAQSTRWMPGTVNRPVSLPLTERQNNFSFHTLLVAAGERRVWIFFDIKWKTKNKN